MINCRLSNKLTEQNEQFKSSEHVHLKGVQLKRRAWYRQRHRKVIITVISSSLQWCSHSTGAHTLQFTLAWQCTALEMKQKYF